jgi:hypothetical protein
MLGKCVKTVFPYIRRAIFQFDEFQEAKHFPACSSACTDQVIDPVLAVNPQGSIADHPIID